MIDPFHSGERFVQERTGEREQALLNGRLISDVVPTGALPFLAEQRHALMGHVHPDGTVWASVLTGPPAFVRPDEDRRALTLFGAMADGGRVQPNGLDAIREADHVGLLFIDLTSRRRLRVNGHCRRNDGEALAVTIDQAHPLCPKYIQRRERRLEDMSLDTSPRTGVGTVALPIEADGHALTPMVREWIHTADTCFVASADPTGKADVSHRGGRPGFIHIEGETLLVPEYPGNSLFNTLGNFALNPRAGLVFWDFVGARQLQLTGEVALYLDATDQPAARTRLETGGTARWWAFSPTRWSIGPLAHADVWDLVEGSRYNP